MKKSLIAIAVSTSAFSMSAVHAADGVEIYGNIQTVYTIQEATPDDTAQLEDNGSTFGFKGEKELKNGLTGFFKYELEADADEKTSDITVNLDQAYIGVKGGFGSVQIGSFDSIYDNAIQDGVDQFEYLGFEEADTTDEGDTIAYFSPSLGGLEIHVSAQTIGNGEKGETVTDTAVTTAVQYSTGVLTLTLGYDSLNNTADKDETFGFSTGLALGDTSLSFKYETNSDDIYLGLAVHAPYSEGRVYGSYQTVDLDDNASEDYDEYGVGVTYNLDTDGDVFVYAEVGQTGTSENGVTALGAVYAF